MEIKRFGWTDSHSWIYVDSCQGPDHRRPVISRHGQHI